jgi:hypothetical protein
MKLSNRPKSSEMEKEQSKLKSKSNKESETDDTKNEKPKSTFLIDWVSSLSCIGCHTHQRDDVIHV